MKKGPAKLTAKKDVLLAKYRTTKSETQEYETIRQNVDALLKQSSREEKMQELEFQ